MMSGPEQSENILKQAIRSLIPLFDQAAQKAAFLIIDTTREYTSEPDASVVDRRTNDIEKAVKAIKFLSDNFHEKFSRVPQIWVADHKIAKDELPENLGKVTRADVIRAYEAFDIRDEDDIFVKGTWNAFATGRNVGEPGSLTDLLKKKGVDTVILSGMTITQCIQATARHALKDGFNVVCIDEAIAGGILDNSLKERQNAVEELMTIGVTVISLSSVAKAYGLNAQPLLQEFEDMDARLPPPRGLLHRISDIFRRSPS